MSRTRRGGFLSVKRRLSAAKHFAKRHSRKIQFAALAAGLAYGTKLKVDRMKELAKHIVETNRAKKLKRQY